jgi:hypothetical protein
MTRVARATRRRLVPSLAAALVLACSAGPRAKVDEPMDVAADPPLVLSAQTPSGEAIPTAASGAPQTLQVQVSQIDNPSGQAFAIAVSLAGPSPLAVGSVAPFPSNQPSRLTLLVPPAVQSAIAAGPAPPRFRLSLQPVASDRPLVAPLQMIVSLPVLGPG